MLVFTRLKGQRTNLYLKTPHGLKYLGSVVALGKHRTGFDFAKDEVKVVRDEIDGQKPRGETAA